MCGSLNQQRFETVVHRLKPPACMSEPSERLWKSISRFLVNDVGKVLRSSKERRRPACCSWPTRNSTTTEKLYFIGESGPKLFVWKSLWPPTCPAELIVLTCRWLKKLPKAEACKFDGFVRSRGVWNTYAQRPRFLVYIPRMLCKQFYLRWYLYGMPWCYIWNIPNVAQT